MARIGRYSGSERLDPNTLKEPDQDDEHSRRLWLEEVYEDDDFRAELKKNVEAMRTGIQVTMDPKDLTIHTVGESHIDCAWLWRFEQTRQKAAITFKKAVTHAKMFPKKFSFALSEPLLLEWILEDQPALFKEIQDTVKSGEIELVGGSYVEPDCMMPSGEAFSRSRLFGMRFLKEHFGVLPEVEWFLDSFGYNWGIPQILKKSGAKFFWTTKITWNLITTFPFVYFNWQGPDGTSIFTANFPMGLGTVNSWLRFDLGRRPIKKDGIKVWNYEMDYDELDEHVEEEVSIPHVGNFFGRGDGGHGPTHQEVAQMNYYAELGFTKWSKVHDFYRTIVKWEDQLPVWNDELYLENHQGTFSVHAEVKRHNRKYENALTSMETLALLTSLIDPTYKYPFATIESMWKMVLRNQFHDVLPGSSIPEVYDDCWDDWCWADETIAKLEKETGMVWAKHAKGKRFEGDVTGVQSTEVALYNPVVWDRRGPVFIPISVFGAVPTLNSQGKPNYAILEILNDPGRQYICQPIAAEPENTIEAKPAGWYTIINLKGVSVTPAQIRILSDVESQKMASKIDFQTSATTFSNGIVNLKLDPETGAILEYTAKGINNEHNLFVGKSSHLTEIYEDTPKQWPAWNLKEEYWKYPVNFPNNKDVKIEIIEKGPIFLTIAISRTLGISPVTQKITLYQDMAELYCEYLTDWKTHEVMLKVGYMTATKAEYSTADISYAAIQRKTQPITPCDKARYEKIMHKFCDVSTPKNEWGIAILNEGKYAFDTMGDAGNIRLTMLRSPPYPGPSGESWAHQERAMNKEKYKHDVPVYSGLGPFKCRYALLPHKGGALVNESGEPHPVVKRRAEEFNQPVEILPAIGMTGIKDEGVLIGESLLEIPTPNVFLGALKQNEWAKNGNIIVRIVEGSGLPAEAVVKFNPRLVQTIKTVRPVDILEREIHEEFNWDPSTGILSFKMHKFEIKTFEFVVN
jgi:alpha-mannosidase